MVCPEKTFSCIFSFCPVVDLKITETTDGGRRRKKCGNRPGSQVQTGDYLSGEALAVNIRGESLNRATAAEAISECLKMPSKTSHGVYWGDIRLTKDVQLVSGMISFPV